MWQTAAQQNQIAGFEAFDGPADVTQSRAFADPDQFHFRMVMPQEMKYRLLVLADHKGVSPCFRERNQLGVLADARSANFFHGCRDRVFYATILDKDVVRLKNPETHLLNPKNRSSPVSRSILTGILC